MVNKIIIFLCCIFLIFSSYSQEKLTIEIEKPKNSRIEVNYYKAVFVNIDGSEFVEYKIDSLSYLQNNNILLIPVPYNSCYLIELYNGENYNYIQIESGNSSISTINLNYSNLDKGRTCIYFDRKSQSYKYFIKNEKSD
jgi:hypothetical protein